MWNYKIYQLEFMFFKDNNLKNLLQSNTEWIGYSKFYIDDLLTPSQ